MAAEGGASLAAELAAARDPRLGCGVGKILAGLDEPDRADLAAALDLESGYHHSTIAGVLTRRGHRVTGNTVGMHRRGICGCFR